MSRFEKIGNYPIYFDQMYYIAYAGGHRELKSKDQDNWNRTNALPGLLQVKERNKLGLDANPNVVPIKGVELLSFIKELQFVPFFDRAFESTHLVKLTDVFMYEYIKSHSSGSLKLGG